MVALGALQAQAEENLRRVRYRLMELVVAHLSVPVDGGRLLPFPRHRHNAAHELIVGPIAANSTVNGKTAGCPNGNWSGVNPVWEGGRTATLTITQGGKTVYTSATISY